MKILLLNTSDRTGGAAIAANRLMQALRKAGHDVKMLVRDKQTDDENVVSVNTSWIKKQINFVRFCYERWVIFVHNRFSRKNLFFVSIANTGTDISRHPLVKEADIIHLHWINQGFLSLSDIKKLVNSTKPVVWTMHDMWVGTGICHYVADSCENFLETCHHCPLLLSPKNKDLSYKIWNRKKIFAEKISFVGCSRWISECAQQSALLKNAHITPIPNPIDVELFKPQDKATVRRKFGLPSDKKLILFAAANLSDKRKGIDYFVDACRFLAQQGDKFEIMLLGGKVDEQLLQIIPLATHLLGYVSTPEDICAAYSAADVFVTPSLSENLPNTIMEAMACGTPCVGFHTGGIPEMIDHLQNGYVAKYKDAEDLAKGIVWALQQDNNTLSKSAVEKVEKNYTQKIVAQKYIQLYQSIKN